MTRQEYIADLAYHLNDLNKDEFDDMIHYIQEYFDEAGAENEQQVIDELGPANKLAATLRAEATIKNQQAKQDKANEEAEEDTPYSKKKDIKALWIILLGIFALPIALPLAGGLFAVLMAVVAVLFALVVVGIVGGVVLIIASLFSLASAIPLFATNAMGALIALGASLCMIGVGILLLHIATQTIAKTIPWITKTLTNLFQKLKRKTAPKHTAEEAI